MTRRDLVERTGADLEGFEPGVTVAIIPIGAIEWHGRHLPLGTDGYLADSLCRETASRGPAVVLPTFWLATGLMPKAYSIGMSPATAEAVLRETSLDLLRVGFAGVVCFSGHFSFAQRAMLARYQRLMLEAGKNCHAVALPDLLKGSRSRFYDHAGAIETSLMLLYQPGRTAVENVPAEAPSDWADAFRHHGVSGEWPAAGTAERGRELADVIVDGLSALVAVVAAGGDGALAESRRRIDAALGELGRVDPAYRDWIIDGAGDIERTWEEPFRAVDDGHGWFRCASD